MTKTSHTFPEIQLEPFAAMTAAEELELPIILGCVGTKVDLPPGRYSAPAADLYCSPLWEKRRAYAERSGRPWAILSARYGLLEPERRVLTYEETISSARKRPTWPIWKRRVAGVLRSDGWGQVEVHAGAPYIAALLEAMPSLEIVAPMAGLMIGDTLATYNAAAGV